jgi:hypothetical protein
MDDSFFGSFGTSGGAGAPMRDSYGNIVATRQPYNSNNPLQASMSTDELKQRKTKENRDMLLK